MPVFLSTDFTYVQLGVLPPDTTTRRVSPKMVTPIYTCKEGPLFGTASNEGGAEDVLAGGVQGEELAVRPHHLAPEILQMPCRKVKPPEPVGVGQHEHLPVFSVGVPIFCEKAPRCLLA